jgi:hypothetical protein
MQATPPSSLPSIVRTYPSARAIRRDAQDPYDQTGYTVLSTTGLAHSGSLNPLLFLVHEFGWPRRQHLVITYTPPTHPHRVKAGR